MTAALQLEKAGASSTLQDGGRYGYLKQGVSPAGAFDQLLHATANRLVRNPLGTAAIEVVLRGDSYRVLANSCRCAVAGDFALTIDGEKAAPWRSHTLRRGQLLTVGNGGTSVRGYVAVAGGFDLHPVLGSLSSHTRTGIGPFDGRVLQAGAVLPLKMAQAPAGGDLRFNLSALPKPRGHLRVVLGPQDHYFSAEHIQEFLQAEFLLTRECDRMGFQIRGPDIPYRKDIPLISEGVALGSIQVLEKGLFIINLVDRQTVGGYPKIATIVGSDVRDLAQTLPGTKLRFEAVDIAAAQASFRERSLFIQHLERHLRPADPEDLTSEELLEVNLISGVCFGDQI